MIPILYKRTEKEFETNGIGRLVDAISCEVEEERNGVFELEMKYPIDGAYFAEIEKGKIIKAKSSEDPTPQPFRIYRITKPLNGIVTINARHLSYDLSKITVAPFAATTCVQALARIKTNSMNDNPFEFWTDKSVTANFSLDTPVSARNILGGMRGSILDTYGTGEYEWDRWTVKLYLHRGANNGVTIRYGKNLTELEHVTDDSEQVSGVAPFWEDNESGQVIVLPEGAIYAPDAAKQTETYTNELGVPYSNGTEEYEGVTTLAQVIPLDLSDKWEEAPTEAQLRAEATRWLNNTSHLLPEENIKVSFVQLWQTEEYKDIAPLERVRLCDTVNVIYGKIGVKVTAKVVRTLYDSLLERYIEMELGDSRTSLSGTIAAQANQIAEVAKTFPSVTQMEAAINSATKLITGGLGGHIVFGLNADGKPNEILIMDTEDKATAVNVIRMNENGIGFSTTGYNGPFRSAWTIDGSFVADFITAGTLDANLLRAGIIMDKAGKNYWNLETGAISIDASSIPDAGVTQADLEKAMAAMRTEAQGYADEAEQAAIDAIKGENYITQTQLDITEQGIMTNVSSIYVNKQDALSNVKTEYYLSTSPTKISGGTWVDTPPEWQNGRYMWQRTTTTMADGTTEVKTVCIAGADGQPGAPGAQGPKGEDGESSLMPYVTASRGTDVSKEENVQVNLRAIVADDTGEDTDPDGSKYTYIWWYVPDGGTRLYLGTGKSIDIRINGDLFEDYAGAWFETGSAADLLYTDGTSVYDNGSGAQYGVAA